MNIHALASLLHVASETAARQAVMHDEYLAFLSLAKTQRRNAGQYRQWAREAEAAGDLERYRKYAAEARKSFDGARWHIEQARIRQNA